MAHGSWEGARLSEPIPSSSRAEDLALAVTVARRYFVDDRTKVEIATELQLSRFKVARLLELARDSGIVRISIGTPDEVDAELAWAGHGPPWRPRPGCGGCPPAMSCSSPAP